MGIADILGWIGATAYAICAVPQVILCIRQGCVKGFSAVYAWLSFTASVLSLIYAIPGGEMMLLLNFGLNIFLWGMILKYVYFPRVKCC